VETQLDDGTMVSTDAFTLVVNAHGGLLEMNMKLPKGHKICLINRATGARVACRVVGARKSSDGAFDVTFEFENPSPEFWPIGFQPPDWQLVNAK
jgi:hypothetical protein